MMNDEILSRLIRVADEPDLSATPYELRGEIGRGGMGTVYRAFDTRLQREVALKVTTAGDASEARIAASLEHPGIVPVYDVGTLPDGRTFHAMRLIRGKPLDLHLTRETPLSERIAIFQKICEAVAFAHSHNIVHRDLKPSNVMVGAFGDVAILDWGVAERRPESPDSAATATVVGTPKFMSPEQSRGESASPSADIYSLGAILKFLLPDNAAAKPLHSIAAKASSVDPAQRYETALALNADISHYLDGFAVAAHQENPAERTIRFIRRNRTLFLLIGAYFLARIAVYFFSGR
jgi:serine/threonine protein kinase